MSKSLPRDSPDGHSETWSEGDSSTFLEGGRFFVPRREEQIAAVCRLVPPSEQAFRILELCPGEGLLAEALLDAHPQARLLALDGSEAMRAATGQRLSRFGDRAAVEAFDLADSSWRRPRDAYRAIVSSLAVHHLDGAGKRQLFEDVLRMLEPGGALILADLVQPASPLGEAFAAETWDEEVRRRSRDLLGDERAFAEFETEAWNHYRHPDPVDQPSGVFEQLQWLAKAGFEAPDLYWMTAGHAIYGARKPG